MKHNHYAKNTESGLIVVKKLMSVCKLLVQTNSNLSKQSKKLFFCTKKKLFIQPKRQWFTFS
jgi:hypothetical protein